MRKKSLGCYEIHKGSNAQVMLNEIFDAPSNLTHFKSVANGIKSLESNLETTSNADKMSYLCGMGRQMITQTKFMLRIW